MSSIDSEAIKKEVRGYYIIFAGLLTLSLTAVAISYLHLPLGAAIFFTLLIAGVQVYLAAGYFMHLLSEKTVFVYVVLALTAVFAIAVLALPSIEHHNPISGTTHTQHSVAQTAPSHMEEEHVP